MRIDKLDPEHDLDEFDCGQEPLNVFLQRHALSNEQGGGCRTYVALDGDRVVGFYSLAAGSMEYRDAPARVSKGQARHPIPLLVLARLAVDSSCQGRGIGRGLLKDAFMRALRAAEIVGIRALVVHAKDEAARDWYLRYAAFQASPVDPLQLVLLMKGVRRALR